ncbi:thioesterase [Methylobacterium tarhaniae]|uniref:Thioesterase n=1 Tax=Methylobacterium tarhaniae TaxID=1187852 RepID=A0A0J6SSV0_9HYPH|nr:thioesterase family protein [Methylobacterium tarhaniae]KMO36627.1 thioesterase [Methylobacterium tarhaniae]
MADDRPVSVFFFAPFVSSTMAIEPGWIDYNGHLNMAYYHVLFDRAVDEAFGVVGLGPDYMETGRGTTFAAEVHVRYRRELVLHDRVRVTLQLVAFDEKRIHFYSEIRHATEGWVAATSENLSLHVDPATRRVAPFPEDIQANLSVMLGSHARLPRPDDLGRVIGIPARGHSRPDTVAFAAAGARVRH